MRSINFLIFAGLISMLNAGCGKKNSDSMAGSSPSPGVSLPPLAGDNVMTLSVNGQACSRNSYFNKPCVRVRICSADATQCQTIDDILLDTGSTGFRVYSSLISIPLPISTDGTRKIHECVQYADGTSQWGRVATANLGFGKEPMVQVPIQLIDSGSNLASTFCPGADETPDTAGFNGILGVGLFLHDCGPDCEEITDNLTYFSCDEATCQGTKISTANQVQNPVARLPQDNNGLVIKLPEVNSRGVAWAEGYVVLGIGTNANNSPSGQTVALAADPTFGEFRTQFGGANYSSFFDTGSNAIYLPDSAGLPPCGPLDGNDLSAWYCPSQSLTQSALNFAFSGNISSNLSFRVGNFIDMITSGNSVFSEAAGEQAGVAGHFDWGLPAYLGRSVYHGFESRTSALGNGPLWAY